jgi:hypothetical protein
MTRTEAIGYMSRKMSSDYHRGEAIGYLDQLMKEDPSLWYGINADLLDEIIMEIENG